MNWEDIQKLDNIYLNIGGGRNHHPYPNYENYISIDLHSSSEGWKIRHDLKMMIPIRGNYVDRILTEDFLEHLKIEHIDALLKECFRILKHRGIMRIGIPDYNNPKDYPYILKGIDKRFPLHVTLTYYKLIKDIIVGSPFSCNYKFYHYWDEGKFVREKIDYSLGFVKRTPDNDMRCKVPGHELQVTSIVVDLFKI